MEEQNNLTTQLLNNLLAGKDVNDLAQSLTDALNTALEEYEKEQAKREEFERLKPETKLHALQNILDSCQVFLSLYEEYIPREERIAAFANIDAARVLESLEAIIPLWYELKGEIKNMFK